MPEVAGTFRHAVGAQAFGPYKVESHVRRSDIYEQYVVALESGMRLSMKSVSPQLTQEGESLVALLEPLSVGLLSVLDFAQGDPGGDVLIVTESAGVTLRERLATGSPIPPPQALSYVRDMSRALGALEARRLPMPTVSPEAVCLRQDGVRLDDYFLPLLFKDRSLPPNFFLAPYSAPELQEASAGSIPTLFSLGIVFFEMLTGRHPFEGSAYQVIASIRTIDVDLARVPEMTRPLLSRLVARDPAERFVSFAELSETFGKDSVVIDPSEWAVRVPDAASEESRPPKKKGPRLEALGVNEFGCQEFQRTQDGATMVLVPAGELAFVHVDSRTSERFEVAVHLDSFLIDKYPVTWAMFAASHKGHDRSCEFCVVSHQVLPSRFMPTPMGARGEGDRSEIERRFTTLNDAISAPEGDTIPVFFLTWREMRRYAEAMGAELPCEAEWEYADRAGTHSLYPWGDAMDPACAWFLANSDGVPHPTGKKKPNAWGLHDMNGNVLEMCRDRFVKDMHEMAATGAINSRELQEGIDRTSGRYSARGGAFTSAESGVTATFRIGAAPDIRSEVRGFRCVIRRKKVPEWATEALS